MPSSDSPFGARTRTLVQSVVIAAALSLGMAPGADAQPIDSSDHSAGEWDIEAYDNCIRKIPTIMDPGAYNRANYSCCVNSGGIYDHGGNKCVAPAARPAGSSRSPFGNIPRDISDSVEVVG